MSKKAVLPQKFGALGFGGKRPESRNRGDRDDSRHYQQLIAHRRDLVEAGAILSSSLAPRG